MATSSTPPTPAAAADAEEAAAFTSSTVCFKCAGRGILHTKKRKRPGLPAIVGIEAEAGGGITVLSEGTKALHLQRPCPVCQGSGRVVSRRKTRVMAVDGVITSGRRPPGFVVKGPLPPQERVEAAQPARGEALCYLTGDFRLFQPLAGHRYSTDDVVTAWAAGKELRRLLLHDGDKNGIQGLDLGTGLGSVLLMMCWQFPSLSYVGVEAQRQNAERAKRSCWVNGCERRTTIEHGDIRGLSSVLGEGKRAFDIVTGTPPYFDAHGAPPPSDPADPPIAVTSLPSYSNNQQQQQQQQQQQGVVVAVARKAASGKARGQPVPLPAAEDQRPCNFEMRGGVEVYCLAAKASLAPGGLFVMCASDLPGQEARVRRAAADAGLALLRKLAVRPKRGQAPLFAVYTLCHANGPAEARFRTAVTSSLLVDPPPLVEEEPAVVGADGVVIETLAVRMAGPGGGGRVPRTEEYRRVMDDMNMPYND